MATPQTKNTPKGVTTVAQLRARLSKLKVTAPIHLRKEDLQKLLDEAEEELRASKQDEKPTEGNMDAEENLYPSEDLSLKQSINALVEELRNGPIKGSANVKPPKPYLEIPGHPRCDWLDWKQNLEQYLIAANLDDRNEKGKRAILHCLIGAEAQRIWGTLTDETGTYDQAMEALTKRFVVKTTRWQERNLFWKRNQRQKETVQEYASALRKIPKGCEFGIRENVIMRDRFVSGLRSRTVRESVLKEMEDESLPLAENLAAKAEAAENLVKQELRKTKEYYEAGDHLDRPRINPPMKRTKKYPLNLSPKIIADNTIDCEMCGFRHLSTARECPASDKACYRCHRKGHFGRNCPIYPGPTDPRKKKGNFQ